MKCFLKDPEWKQCCCNCAYHLPVHFHCTTSSHIRIKGEKCVCGIKKGWSCVPPGAETVFDNWPLHSVGCELYFKKK